VGYVPLNNYNYDSGYRRIQSGPNHQGFIVLTSGSSAYGANEGIVVPGSPLSGNLLNGVWDYDSNWRYVPTTLPNQSGSLDPTPYNASGALDTYNAARIYTRDNVAGAQAASAIGPETGKVNPRGGALQPGANVTRPETYMYFGGGAPDNQDYSPYNTPDANTAAEGKTGGGVTHRNYESSLLTNLLGSQGTSDRSQWRYHQPVYCKTFTETRRSATPGLMSSPLRYVYRGPSTSYNYNYAGELHANKGGFAPLNYDDFGGGCDIPPPCPTTTGDPLNPQPGDILRGSSFCTYKSITWYNTGSNIPIGFGDTYTIQQSDYFHKIYYIVEYPNGSTATSDLSCLNTVSVPGYGTYWISRIGPAWQSSNFQDLNPSVTVDDYGNSFVSWALPESPGLNNNNKKLYLYIRKLNNKGEEIWTKRYNYIVSTIGGSTANKRRNILVDSTNTVLFVGQGKVVPVVGQYILGVDLYKINAITGDLHWYYTHTFPRVGVMTDVGFCRLQWTDSTKSRIAVLYTLDSWSAYCYTLGPTSNPSGTPFFPDIDPTSVTPGGVFTATNSAPLSSTLIEDAMVIKAENRNYLISVDNSNRYIWWETDADFKNLPNSSGLKYGPTTTINYDANCPKLEPTLVTFSGQNYILTASADVDEDTAVISIHDTNRNRVLQTVKKLGIPFAATTNPANTKAVYISTFIGTTTAISGINTGIGAGTILSTVEYVPEENKITSYSTIAVIPNWRPTINTQFVAPAYYGGPSAINNNVNQVNRSVVAFIDGGTTTSVTGSGVNSLFVVSSPIKASGTPKQLEWNPDFIGTSGAQGLIQATNNISQNLGSTAVISPGIFTNQSQGGLASPSGISSGTIDPPFNTPPLDVTGLIPTAYGIESFD
jgi:hypothetical protein